MAPPLPRIPAELRRGPFLGSQARRRGLVTRQQLRGGCWRRLFRDVYVHADVPDTPGLRVRAAALVLPEGGVFSGITAARVHGADLGHPDEAVECTVPPDTRATGRAGLRVRSSTLSETDVCTVEGVPVTAPVRTAFDIARRPTPGGGVTELVVAIDALAHLGLVSPAALAEFARQARFAGWRGVRQVATVAGHTEPRTESPGETRLRMRIVEAGLPRPEAQVWVYDGDGRALARTDLAYPELRVAIEYDGACHERTRMADARRRNRMIEAGWRVYVYTARDLAPGDDTIVRQLRAVVG